MKGAQKARFVIFSWIIFFSCFFFGLNNVEGQTIDITVSATVHGTTTCGDLVCGGIETCGSCPADCGICPGGGDDYYVSPLTKAIFQGKAYPNANITVQRNGTTISTFKADSFGIFEKEISGMAGGTYNFLIFAEDNKEIISAGVSFTAPVLEGKTTMFSRIFIPPTIEVNPTQTARGNQVNIFGQSFPAGKVTLLILPKNILYEINPSLSGDWFYILNTLNLEEGFYILQANASDNEGERSGYSNPVTLSIIKSRCQGADLNFDDEVDLVDFSILLYFWQQTNPKNACADINSDGMVDIIDFSIMMYYWTE